MTFEQRYTYNRQTDKLGGGGFGTVYKAYDNFEKNVVAIKLLTSSTSDRYDLRAEIMRAKRLSHDNLCRYYNLDQKTIKIDGDVELHDVIIMEYITGGPIDKFIAKHPQHRDKLLRDVIKGLRYLHKNGLMHRDISPSNILIDDSVAEPVAKIIDFGISKKVNFENSVSINLIGKPQYMAPEQYRTKLYGENGKIDTRVDLWSFGVVAYELLSGNHLSYNLNINTENWDWVEDIEQAKLNQLIESIQEPWKSVLMRCLVKHANQRVSAADELLDLLNGKTTSPIPDEQKTILLKPIQRSSPKQSPEPKSTKKSKNYLPLVAVFVPFLIGILIVKLWSSKTDIKEKNNEIRLTIPSDTSEAQAFLPSDLDTIMLTDQPSPEANNDALIQLKKELQKINNRDESFSANFETEYGTVIFYANFHSINIDNGILYYKDIQIDLKKDGSKKISGTEILKADIKVNIDNIKNVFVEDDEIIIETLKNTVFLDVHKNTTGHDLSFFEEFYIKIPDGPEGIIIYSDRSETSKIAELLRKTCKMK
jgi:serine/threonine protein kinase